MNFTSIFEWFRTAKSQPTNLTQEEITELVSTMRQEYPDEVNQMLHGIDQIIESKKRDLMEKKVIDVLLQAGQSIAQKCRLNNTVRMRALTVELEQAQKLELSEMAIIETALHESNKMIQNESLKKLNSACQEMYMDFIDNLETHLDLLGEPPEDKSAHPLQPYTLQLLPAEKEGLVDSVEYLENLAQRGEKLKQKMLLFIRTKAPSAIEYHYELLHVNSLSILKKEISIRLNQMQPIPQMDDDLEKIEWLGTQKQLAELFVELQRKGWVNEIQTDLIKKYFLKSDTIAQTLKPAKDKRTGEATYNGIFTKNYKPKFDRIKKITD